MQLESQLESPRSPSSLFQTTSAQYTLIFILLILAFGLRLYHINRPPLDFSSIRQYQSAHIAKALYFQTSESIPESRKQIANLNMQRIGFLLEPRVLENAAVLGYRIAGEDLLWIPRVLSAIFWIIGGIFLYLIAIKTSSFSASFFSTVYYLFLPYSILASRSFQPDPLMLMMTLASVYSILIYFDKSSISRLLVSAAISSAAIIIKPYCLFPIWAVFILVSIHNKGLRKAVFDFNAPTFIVMSFIPSFFYYVLGMLTNAGFMQEHAHGSFLPHLIFSFSFWEGWLLMIGDVTGYFSFILAVVGFVYIRKGLLKTVLAGLWAGYLLLGLSATYQFHTHSYYHIPLIPIAALCLGPISAGAIQFIAKLPYKRWLLSAALFVVFIIASAVWTKGQLKSFSADYKKELKFAASVIGINPAFKEFITGNYEKELRIAKEIGEHVGHSSNTLFLDPTFGRVLAYYGEFSGLPWPTSISLYSRQVRGARTPDISKDFTPNYVMMGFQHKYIKYTPDYFIVTDFQEYEIQSDLRAHLTENFPILVKNKDYIIFDMRKMSKRLGPEKIYN